MSLITDPLPRGAETREQTARIIKMLEDGGPKYPRAWLMYDSTKFLLRRSLQATLLNSPDVWRKPVSTHWDSPASDLHPRMPSVVKSGVFNAEKWTWSHKYGGSRLWGLESATNDGRLVLKYEAWSAVSDEEARAYGIVHVHKYATVTVEPGVRIILSDKFMHSVLDRAERYGVCQSRSVTEPIYQCRLPAAISVVDGNVHRVAFRAVAGHVSTGPQLRLLESADDYEELSEMSPEALNMMVVDLAGMSALVDSVGGLCNLRILRGSVSKNLCLCFPNVRARTILPGVGATNGLQMSSSDSVSFLAAVKLSAVVPDLCTMREGMPDVVEVYGELYQSVLVDVDGLVKWQLAAEQFLDDWYAMCAPEHYDPGDEWPPGDSEERTGSLYQDYRHGDGFSDGSEIQVSDYGDFDWVGPGGPDSSVRDSDDDEASSVGFPTFNPGGSIPLEEYRKAADWAAESTVRVSRAFGDVDYGGFDFAKETLNKWSRLYDRVLAESFADDDPEDHSTIKTRMRSAGFADRFSEAEVVTAVTSAISDDPSDNSAGEDDGDDEVSTYGGEDDAWMRDIWTQNTSDGARVRSARAYMSVGTFGVHDQRVRGLVEDQMRVVSGFEPGDLRFDRAKELYYDMIMRGEVRYELVWPLFLDRRAHEIFIEAIGDVPYEPGLVRKLIMKADVANANLWSGLLQAHEAWLKQGDE